MDRERRKQTCFHYTGLPGFAGNPDVCKAGVDIRALVGGPDAGWARRMPCTPPYRPGDESVPCEKFRAHTDEEIDAEEAKIEESLAKLMRGVSQCCEAPIDESQVITSGPYKGHGPRF